MTDEIIVNPARLSQLGPAEGCVFCLVANPEIADRVSVVREAPYADYLTIPFRSGDRFEDLLQERIPEPAHVLVISPYAFFQSPAGEVLGPRRKLMAMACNSTPASPEVIRHFLTVMERTSAAEQAAFSDRFFDRLESADHLEYVDDKHGTRATLQHLDEDLVWNQQAGPLEWGEQQIVPSGEISVLPTEIVEFDENLRLPLEGEIAFRGYPILHCGTPSFTRKDQSRIHRHLAPMERHAVVARVVRGEIVELRPHDREAAPVVRMLEAMFEVDSRYQLVWEMGHALNTSLDILPGNHAMNEVYGGTQGCLHWGLGLTPYTQYHLDIISPDTTVYTNTGQVVLGTEGGAKADRMAQVVPA
jgi:hypothetical protein